MCVRARMFMYVCIFINYFWYILDIEVMERLEYGDKAHAVDVFFRRHKRGTAYSVFRLFVY